MMPSEAVPQQAMLQWNVELQRLEILKSRDQVRRQAPDLPAWVPSGTAQPERRAQAKGTGTWTWASAPWQP